MLAKNTLQFSLLACNTFLRAQLLQRVRQCGGVDACWRGPNMFVHHISGLFYARFAAETVRITAASRQRHSQILGGEFHFAVYTQRWTDTFTMC